MDRTRKRNKNVDLWLELDAAIDKHLYVEFRHVKGHSDVEYNEIVDKLAGEARIAWQNRAV
jgi:ribonuclease HI